MIHLFNVSQTDARDGLDLEESDTIASDDSATAWASIRVHGTDYLAQYSANSGRSTLLPVGVADLMQKDVQLQAGADLIRAFELGDRAFVMSYKRESGLFQLRELNADFTLGGSMNFRRTHEPGVTAGFTTVEVFDEGNRVAFMGYNHEDGRVVIFSIEMTAHAPKDGLPLAVHTAWSWQWATGWTRFAFFALGDETFFLKTNDIWHNVNIDHVNRNRDLGTNEVATQMKLPDAYELSLVTPLMMGRGDPYFVAYKPDGDARIYRIHADCEGWTEAARFAAAAQAKALHCIGRGARARLALVA